MRPIHYSILASSHANWELTYKDSQPVKETRSNKIANLIAVTIVYPLCFLAGALISTASLFQYAKSIWNQHKIITILSNPKRLKEYAEKRTQICEKQIKDLKSRAIELMERDFKKLADVGLPIPQKKKFSDYFSPELPKDYWKDFPWNEFLNTDFFQKSNNPKTTAKDTLEQFEGIRTKINYLSHQKLVLSNPEGRVEAIKKIAEMSFIKNAFERQRLKEMAISSLSMLIPSGLFWYAHLSSRNDRLIYEGNKNFLPVGTNLRTYNDLLDAHNKLVRNNDFVVPYIAHTII